MPGNFKHPSNPEARWALVQTARETEAALVAQSRQTFNDFQKRASAAIESLVIEPARLTVYFDGRLQDPASPIVSDDVRKAIVERDQSRCRYCARRVGGRIVGHIDHVVPRNQGGLTTFENCVLSCPGCNNIKGGRIPQEANMLLIPVNDLSRVVKVIYLPLPIKKD